MVSMGKGQNQYISFSSVSFLPLIISVWWFCRGQTVWHLPPPRLWIFDMVLNLFGWWKPTPAPTPPTSVIPPPPMALLGAYALLPRVVPRKYKKYRNCLGKHGCIFLRKPKQRGSWKISIRLRKVKNLVNNASILTIISLKSCKILENYLLTNKFFFIFWKISEF